MNLCLPHPDLRHAILCLKIFNDGFDDLRWFEDIEDEFDGFRTIIILKKITVSRRKKKFIEVLFDVRAMLRDDVIFFLLTKDLDDNFVVIRFLNDLVSVFFFLYYKFPDVGIQIKKTREFLLAHWFF